MEKNEGGPKEKKSMHTEITSNTKLAATIYSQETYKGAGISDTNYETSNPKRFEFLFC